MANIKTAAEELAEVQLAISRVTLGGFPEPCESGVFCTGGEAKGASGASSRRRELQLI